MRELETMIRVMPLSILASAILLSLAACGTPTPTSGSPPAGPQEEVIAARDAAITYVRAHYGELAPGPDLVWLEQRVTPEGLAGKETYRYSTETWDLTISYPVPPPESVVYQITIHGLTTAFHWEGEVDAQGTVVELTAPEIMLDRIGARDSALAYLRKHYEHAPAESLPWKEERMTQEGIVGAETYRYEAAGWLVEISYPVVAPAAMVYRVQVSNATLGFLWQGSVDAQGAVTEEELQ